MKSTSNETRPNHTRQVAMALVALSLASGTVTAEAKGVVKGAVVGATAGHFVGHGHAKAGAVAGAVVGHHEASRKAAKAK
jgi:uncharacterized protein YcfJ